MTFDDVLAQLPALSVAERQILVRRAVELDEPEISPEEEALVERRLADHHIDPASAVDLGEMKSRLRARFAR